MRYDVNYICDGFRAKWTVDLDDLCTVDNTRFVKLPRRDVTTSSFARLVFGSTKLADGEVTSMSGSLGLASLIQLRNEAQAQHMASADIPDGIADVLEEQARPLKRARTTRQQITNLRNSPSVMQIDVPEVGESVSFVLQVLRPVSIRDDLWVPLDEAAVELLIKYLKAAGFGEAPMPRKHDRRLPAGVEVRTEHKTIKSFFLVKGSGETPTKQRKVQSIEEAFSISAGSV